MASWRARERVAPARGAREDWFWPKPWAGEVVWPGARRLASQVASAGVRTPPVGMVQGRSEVGDDVSGSFVIFSKSKNQFCKFIFFSFFLAPNEKLMNTIFVQCFEIYNFHVMYFFV